MPDCLCRAASIGLARPLSLGKTDEGKKRMGISQMTITINVSNEAQLRNAIFQLSDDFARNGVAPDSYVVNIDANITLTGVLMIDPVCVLDDLARAAMRPAEGTCR
jgi:hypothetical protein